MPETTARELKLVQYLNEAYGKEKQLETALQAQIKLMQRPAVKKRLQEHLKETKAQARGLERRIKALGGKADAASIPGPEIAGDAASAVASVANKAMAAAKGPVQALRGTGKADQQLRNLRDVFWNEAEEIAHYNIIEAVAEQLSDKETAKLARAFRRQEERMQAFVAKHLPSFVREVIREEVPPKERKPDGASTSRRSSRSTAASRSKSSTSRAKSSASRSKSSASGSKAASSRAKSTTSSSSRSKSSSSRSRSSGSGSSTRRTSSRRSSGS